MKRKLLFLLLIVVAVSCEKENEKEKLFIMDADLTVLPANKTITEGESFVIVATFAHKSTMDNTVAWSSSDNSVADVNSLGVVTAKKAGTASIVATSIQNNKMAKCHVIVERKGVKNLYLPILPQPEHKSTKNNPPVKKRSPLDHKRLIDPVQDWSF